MRPLRAALLLALAATALRAPAAAVTAAEAAAAAPRAAFVDVGSRFDVPVDGANKYFSPASFARSADFVGDAFRSGRQGADFSYAFALRPGAYNVVLAFGEYVPELCSTGARVFNVYVNGEIKLEGLDVFDSAAACRAGWQHTIAATVSSVNTEPLTVRFESVVNPAIVSVISISSAVSDCLPASDTAAFADNQDHAAHAVPGSYPPQLDANSPKSYVDNDGDGYEPVFIDGRSSHTHFFDSANNVVGRLTDYTWSIVETGQVISKAHSFYFHFPLGTTRLKLAVVDNSCSTDEVETTVTVTGAVQPGMYCYYYAGLPKVMGDDPLGAPQFGAIAASPNLGFPALPFRSPTFVARCFFFLDIVHGEEAAAISISASGGAARVFKGADLLLDTDGMSSSQTELPVGLLALEIIYERTEPSKDAAVQLLVQGAVPPPSRIFYDQREVLPILSALSPPDGPDSGGVSVKVSGYGLFRPLTVSFGGNTVSAGGQTNPNQLFVTAPPAAAAAVAEVSVTNAIGLTSNSLRFSYGSTCDPVRFDNAQLKTAAGGSINDLDTPTCVALGGDGKLYIGSTDSTVQVLGYDSQSLIVTSHCYSKRISNFNFQKNSLPSERVILGIALDPRDQTPRPYVSTSTLDWFRKNKVDKSNTAAWRNGAIERLTPGRDPTDARVCLVFDQRIVSGLPVANFDHAINGIVFTQNGDLLIAVGSFTNTGLPDSSTGNYWETTMSAAILIAKLSKGASFDGVITYSHPGDPERAKQISGDVELYSTGHRNTFGMTMARSGNIFGVDQGPNCGYGNTATACDEYSQQQSATYFEMASTSWPGRVRHGCDQAPYSITRADKILHITRGSFYGHPNLQRGGAECAWIDPLYGKTALDKPAPPTYKAPMALVQSSVTGIGEYGSNHFCGNLRGDIILSRFQGGKVHRMRVNGGSRISGPDEMTRGGEMSFVENQNGDLIFPMYNEKKVVVLRPKVAPKAFLYLANAVPWRHGKGGGTKVIIGGQNFGQAPSVTVGGSTCAVLASSDTQITCTVPPSSPGPKDVVVFSGGNSATLSGALLYMNV